ncbi:phosphotransferase enzyme family protein [uncultured Clostridium sp.]|uniref:phosphotransferase enzyme family protein n=1 Tax=uncultured Clostridium sp. TaxID=59620 RepID=UPI0025FC7EB3|nr:phosphotransferase [uncultured Clostridium sp.]
MAFENIELYNKIANNALKNYGWKSTHKPELIVLSENATYMIKEKITGKKDGVLRISKPGYHTLEELQSELQWLQQINDYTPLQVANPIKGINGEYIQIVKGDDGDNYYCIVCEYLTGKAPDEGNIDAMKKQFKYLGETTAYLHRQTEIWNGTKHLNRIEMNYDNMIGKYHIWGRWQDYPEMTAEAESLFTKVAAIIKKRLQRYGKNENNYGLIHGDLRLANLLIDGEQIKVIDFDDCSFGWHLSDLASALTFMEEKPFVADLINAWLYGYRSVLPFTDTDFEEIDTFIMLRRLQIMGWLGSHTHLENLEELKDGYMDGTIILAERYVRMFG